MGLVIVTALVLLIQVCFVVEPVNAAANNDPLKIGAFNVRVFGVTKIKKQDVRDILVQVINRYDIILIQEIRDAQGHSINTLLGEVNKEAAKRNYSYKMVISPGIGRSTSKEQYAFLYRYDLVSITNMYVYDDKNDVFEREPFIVRFSAPNAAVSDFAFIAIHTKPSDAVNEINGLVEVYNDVVRKWRMSNIVIMGDLNAACNYVKDMDWQHIRLATDNTFWWLIDDCQDTSVEGLRCAYDRFIATGQEMLTGIVENSAIVFNMKQAYNLNQQQVTNVSDHFPIEFHIKGAAWNNIQEESEYVLKNSLSTITKRSVFGLRRGPYRQAYTLQSLYSRTGGASQLSAVKFFSDLRSAMNHVEQLSRNFPTLVTNTQSQMTKYYLSKIQTVIYRYPYQTLNQYTAFNKIKIELSCNVRAPISCKLIIGKSII